MVKEFLESGIIERYCLNDVSGAERAEVELMCENYEVVKKEIALFEENMQLSTLGKSSSLSKVKYRLMRQIYTSTANTNMKFVPLMDGGNYQKNLMEVLQQNNVEPYLPFSANIKTIPLPSTLEVQNAAVWIRGVFNEEIHHNENEYIHIVNGSCKMNLDGNKKVYKEGDLIFIPPKVKHSAKIISNEPMFAVVQRQLLAQG